MGRGINSLTGILLLAVLALVVSGCTSTGTAVPAATPTAVQAPPTPTLLPTPTATQPPPIPTATKTPTDFPTLDPTIDLTQFTATATSPSLDETHAVAATAVKRIIRALHYGDMKTVAYYVSLKQGLEFRALDLEYGCLPVYPIQHYSPDQVPDLLSGTAGFVWKCGGDSPQNYPFRDVFVSQFMDLDYTKPSRILYNDQAGLPYEKSTFQFMSSAGYMLVEYVVDPQPVPDNPPDNYVQPPPYHPTGLVLVFVKEDMWRLVEIDRDAWTP